MTMSGAVALRTLALGVVLAGAVVLSASPAPAHHCLGQASLDRAGGAAEAGCHGNYPPGPPSTTSQLALWERYCYYAQEGFSGWSEGSTVTINYLGRLGADELSRLDLDPSGEYGTLQADCTSAATGVSFVGGQFVYTIAAPVPPEVLRDRAAARLNPPTPTLGSSPPLGERPAIVHFATWLWVTDPWEAQTETESAGLVTVDVIARPDRITWVFGDGGVVVCAGPGIEWSPAVTEAGTYCSHTFGTSSTGQPGAAYSATATVTWVFSWAINGVDQGDFGSFDATTNFDIQVGEIQSIETNG